MNGFFAFAVQFATLCVGIAMVLASVRLFRGPSAQDRVLAFDAFYINGMLMLLMQAHAHPVPGRTSTSRS